MKLMYNEHIKNFNKILTYAGFKFLTRRAKGNNANHPATERADKISL